MNTKIFQPPGCRGALRGAIAILCTISLASGNPTYIAQDPNQAPPSRISNDQLDAMVTPIALYPDGLVGQVLVASTYPLEIVQLNQWLEKNKGLTGKALTDAVEKQPWDPSVQAMATFPDVVKNMTENVKWTADLGNAFLAQQGDVMDAIQRMRTRAQQSGNLQSTQQQTVQTRVEDNKTVVVIEPSNPEVVYVPTYDPVAVWGAPVAYPYPPVYYPPGYVATGLISFGVGMAIGAAWGGGGWGWGCGWGGSNININNNNAFINHYNSNRVNGGNRYAGNGNSWQHNPAHRGGAPYGDRSTAQRFGGSTAAGRQDAVRQNAGRMQQNGIGNARPNTGGGVGAANRMAPGGGVGSPNRGGNGGGIGSANRAAPGGGMGGAGAGAARSGMGGDNIGNRQTSRSSAGQGAFGGASSGGNRGNAGQSMQRGRSSMGGGGGGGMRGGGARGGGRRR